MELKIHQLNTQEIAEVQGTERIIKTVEDGIDLMGNVYYQGYDQMIVYQHQLTPDFFDLSTKVAGEILQKFSTYRVRLAIVGDFASLMQENKRLQEFIYESNKGNLVRFTDSLSNAIHWFNSK